jgi:ABC-type Zn uptake system ZnuABC Zn-binding protein ZnuA
VTVHDGYGYLLQVGSISLASFSGARAHSSATELRDMVRLLQREKITVVFSETFPAPR